MSNPPDNSPDAASPENGRDARLDCGNVPMERLLKDYARQRRDQFGDKAAMHPATRRLLQGEVQRQYKGKAAAPGGAGAGTAGRGSLTGLLLNWRPFVLAFGSITVLAALIWLTLPHRDNSPEAFHLAKQESDRTRPAAKPAELSDETLRESKVMRKTEENELAKATSLDSAAPPPPATPPPPGLPPRRDAGRPLNLAENALSDRLGAAKDQPAPNNAPAPAPLATTDARDKENVKLQLRPADGSAAGNPGASVLLQRENRAGQRDQVPGGPAAKAPVTPSQMPTLARSEAESLRRRLEPTAERQTESLSFAFGNGNERNANSNAQRAYFRARSQANLGRGYQAQAAPAAAAARPVTAPTSTPVAAAAGAQQVLTSFELEQSGDQVRVIDADGSVYAGYLYTAPANGGFGGGTLSVQPNGGAQPLPTSRTQARAPADQFGRQNQAGAVVVTTADYYKTQVQNGASLNMVNFRVLGTNRTLREAVELDGVLLPADNADNADTGQTKATTPSPGEAPAILSATKAKSAETELKRAEPAPAGTVGRYAAEPLGNRAAAGQIQNQILNQAQGLTNFSSIQRIQGNLRVGPNTNVVPVDAYRSVP